MCYTSGTTGRPKGVLYSHRAIVLHSFALGLRDALSIGEDDTVLPIVPMFHVNAWGLPFAAPLFGASQVFPGPYLDAPSVARPAGPGTCDLDRRRADGLARQCCRNSTRIPASYDLSALRAIVVGGSAAPLSMIRGFEERHGLSILHAWGMTEMTPLGTICNVPTTVRCTPPEERLRYRATQGTPLPFVEIRARTDEGIAPWDGETMGELEVRGPWVAAQYYNSTGSDPRFTEDGWFKTGES